jgi:hypothetical protein
MTYSVVLTLSDQSAGDRADNTVNAMAVKIAELGNTKHKPVEAGPGTWTLTFFTGEPGTKGVERLLAEIDPGWNQYLQVSWARPS